MAPCRLGALAFAALGGLLEMAAAFHFPEDTLALHLLLQGAEGLVNVVVAYVNLHGGLNLLRLSVELFKSQKRDTSLSTLNLTRIYFVLLTTTSIQILAKSSSTISNSVSTDHR